MNTRLFVSLLCSTPPLEATLNSTTDIWGRSLISFNAHLNLLANTSTMQTTSWSLTLPYENIKRGKLVFSYPIGRDSGIGFYD